MRRIQVYLGALGLVMGMALSAGCGGRAESEEQLSSVVENTEKLEKAEEQVDSEEPHGKLLGQLYADVCRQDGMKDMIQIWVSDARAVDSESLLDTNADMAEYLRQAGYVSVEIYDGSVTDTDGGIVIDTPVFDYTIATTHAGWSNIGLIRREEKAYLIIYNHYMIMGEGSFGYEIFSLDGMGEQVIYQEDWCRYTLPEVRGIEVESLMELSERYEEYVSVDKLEQMAADLDVILADVMRLASGNTIPEKCYAFSLKRDADWEFRPRNSGAASSGTGIFLQGLGGYGNEIDQKKEIADWCKEWKLDWAQSIPAEILDGGEVYDGVTVGAGAEGSNRGDCQAFIADLIPGEYLQLLVQDREGMHRCLVWEKGVDYQDERKDWTFLDTFEGLYGDENGFVLYCTTFYRSDVYYDSFVGGELKELASSWGSSPEKNYMVDVDGDGTRELICDVVYYADGAGRTIVYWKKDGEIYSGDAMNLLDVEVEYRGVGSVYSEYLPKEKKVRIYYWVESLEDFAHKDYGIDLDRLEGGKYFY